MVDNFSSFLAISDKYIWTHIRTGEKIYLVYTNLKIEKLKTEADPNKKYHGIFSYFDHGKPGIS